MGWLAHSQEMILCFGEDPRWADAFGSEAECREAWMRERDGILTAYRHRRPWGWWKFQAPIPYPGYDHERSTLFEAGLLGEEERAELMRWWRAEFERTWSPHFFFVESGCVFTGRVARRKHFRWADVPKALEREWTRERRRRRRTIRELETPAAEHPAA